VHAAAMLKKLWHDPVWSKVIAGAILAASATLGTYLSIESGVTLVQSPVWRRVWLVSVPFAALLVGAIWYYAQRRRRRAQLRAQLTVSVDKTFPHVPCINIGVHNPGRKPVIVSAVEFMTKQHWDMPDPRRTGVTAPVVNFLPAGSAFVKIAIEKGSVTSKAIAATLAPGQSLEVSFRLITDHAPAFGIGLFPYHLAVDLVLEDGSHRLHLPDLIVSLHGYTTLSVADGQPMPFMMKPGDIQHYANAVLSKVAQGATCAPEILEILKSASRSVPSAASPMQRVG
jgi:hypothetical protein